MRKIFSLLAVIFFAGSMTAANLLNIDFTKGQGEWEVNDVFLSPALNYVWQQNSQYGMKASAYVSNKCQVSISALISPEIDLSAVDTAALLFSHALNKGTHENLAVVISLDGGATWADTLDIDPWPAGTNWDFVDVAVDLKPYVGHANTKLAFVYTSTTANAPTWEIKTVVVTDGAEPEPIPEPQNLGPKSIAEFLEMKNDFDTCELTGVVAAIRNAQYGNLYLVDGTDTLDVYGVLTPDGKQKKFETLDVEVEDTLTIKAVYAEYQGAPQVKNAIFVSVRKLYVEPQEYTVSMATGEAMVIYTDATLNDGWWQIQAQDSLFYITLSNGALVDAPAGTYTVDALDPEYSFIYFNETNKEVAFTEGSITLAISDEGAITITGTLYDKHHNAYIIDIYYIDPTPEHEVALVCEGEVEDYTVSGYGYLVMAFNADSTLGVQLLLDISHFEGDYDEWSLDAESSYVILDDHGMDIFTAKINIFAKENDTYLVLAELLCYDNTVYKFTIGIGYMPSQEEGIDNTEIRTKATKAIQNGQLIIEKNGVRYNANGAVVNKNTEK